MGLLTSTEGIDHLREFFETSNKLIDLRKISNCSPPSRAERDNVSHAS
jgi:hypothetical protein